MKSEVQLIEPSEAREVFDKETLMEQYRGDELFLRELLGMFLDDAPIKIEKMQEHLEVAARNHELDRAQELAAKIQQEFERFKRVLDASEVLKSR